MLSMTGFGSGSAPLGAGELVVEVRALNHRFLDVRVRLPPELGEQNFFVEQLARERLDRGRYDIGGRLQGAALPPPRLDVERARSVYAALTALRDEVAIGTEVPLAAVLSLPGVVSSGPALEPESAQRALRAALDQALVALDEMRRREAAALRAHLCDHLGTARRLRDEMERRAAEVRDVYHGRLRDRVARLLADVAVPIDAGRLENELAILADRCDITEELARLTSHFDQLERLLAQHEPVGRRLDFLLQEVAREANTVGAKSQDAPLAHLVVELKAETERMREQVQNVL